MNEWFMKAKDLIVLALGNGHSSTERVIIAACGVLAFFLTLKIFTKEDGGANSAWIRRFLAAVLILGSVLLSSVAADIWVIPYVTNDILQKAIFIVIPVLTIVVITAPLLMLVLRKDYGGTLVTAMSALIACYIVVFTIGFIVDSFSGSDKEFRSLKRRTHDIDEFINH